MGVAFPAFCPSCGFIFKSGFRLGGTNVTLEGNRARCPRCHAWAELPDGTFNVVGDTIEVLAASDLTVERLARLQAILERARDHDISVDEAVQALAAEAPALTPFLARYGPKLGAALIAFLWALFGILGGQVLDDSATKEDVREVVERAVERCVQAPPEPD